MTMPTDVVDMVNQCRQHMLVHAQHALTPIDRYGIYKTFWEADSEYGHKAYQKLCIVTARYVLPLWKQVLPQDSFVYLIWEAINQVLAGTTEPIQAEKIAEDIWQEIESRSSSTLSSQEIRALCVAEATLRALWAVMDRTLFGGAKIEVTYTDADIDPWSSDTAQWAVTALAGGVWDSESNSGERRKFWLWWLDEAIPFAWYTRGDIQLDLMV